jgi:hypothetical protein
MAVQQKRVSVGTSPTLIIGNGENPIICRVHNATTGSIYLGGSDVTTSTGYHLESTESMEITLVHANSLFGIVTSGTKDLTVIWQEV